MKPRIHAFPGYRSPDPDDGAGGGEDRGDALTEEQEAAAAAAAAAEAAEAKAAELTDEEKAALPGAKGEAKGEEGEEGDEGKPAAKAKPIMIPKARFDEVITKGKEREAELRARIEALTRTSTSDAVTANVEAIETAITELEAKHKAALDDGKSEVATALLREIRIRERQISDLRSEFKSEQARLLAVEQVKVDLLISRLEEQFPQIDPESEEYDQETVDEVLFLRQSFEAKGLPSSEALSRAMKYVFAQAPAKAEGEEKKGLAAAAAGGDRKGKAVAKAVDAARRTPPSPAVTGLDGDKKGGSAETNVEKMTEEEFEALPESTKARLRGDFA